MKSTNRKDWPDIPAGLKYVDLRLPGTFRELVANENFTNEQIGRIIRCLALDTDYFIDHDIEVEVRYYRQCLVSRNNTRLRVQECRKRRKEGAAGVLSSSMDKSRSSGNGVSVTVTESAEKAACGTVDTLSIQEKTPSYLKEKHPPIIPPKKKAPLSLEKSGSRGKRESIAAGIQSDLFMGSFGAEDGSRSPESPETASTSPQKSEEVSGGAVAPQDIESSSSGVIRRSRVEANSSPSVDSRNDMAWIPERFSIFWSKYPRKVAKADALKAFTKVIKAQPDVDAFMKTLMASLEWWKRESSWMKDGGKFIPHPATWINRGSWEDSKENSEASGGAQFLRGNDESDEELIRRMQGG
jgi:hypothetical protein